MQHKCHVWKKSSQILSRNVTNQRLEITHNGAVFRQGDAADRLDVGVFRDEAHVAVGKQTMDAAGMQAERLVVRTAVVDAPGAGRGATVRCLPVVNDLGDRARDIQT